MPFRFPDKLFSTVFLTALVVFFSSSFGQSVNVPLEYWGYDFLERMEAKGLFYSFDLRSKPFSRKVFAEILDKIDRTLRKNRGKMTRAEQLLLAQLKGDFIDELRARKSKNLPKQSERHFYRFSETNGSFYFDLYGKESVVSNRGAQYQPDQLLSETSLGGILRGQLGNTVGFYVDARNAITRGEEEVEESDEQFDVSRGSPVVVSGPNVVRDRATAYFVLEKPWLRVQLGRDEIDWGPGYHGALAVSRNMPPTEMIRLSTRFSRFKFTSVHAFLSSSVGSKYLAAHRLDWMVMPGLYLGGSETVIYGNRDVEPAYLNPLMPYHVAEHHLGDRDNNALSVDATVTLIPSTKFYGEFFIDDMTTTQSLTRYFGNKFAFLVGGLWMEPFRLANLDLRFEYARVEPYVYSHWDSINIYTHYDKVIGYWTGPNAETIFLQAGYQLGRDLRIELSAERIRKGEGEADTHSRPESGTKKTFLSGVVEHRKLLGLKIVDQVRRDIFISFSYTYQDVRNLAHVSGRSSFDHLARFELYFNY